MGEDENYFFQTMNKYGLIFYLDKNRIVRKTKNHGVVSYFDENGKLHRESGPAYDDGKAHKAFYKHGEIHNLQGPAVFWPNGREEYWIEGVQYPSKEAWEQRLTEIKSTA